MRPPRSRPARRRRIRGVALGVAVALSAAGGLAFASFSDAPSASHTLSSATLSPASGFSASPACNGLASAKATITWTATPSTFATGYQLQRFKGSTLQATTPVTPSTTTSVTQTGLSTGTTYTWKIWAYYQAWTSTLISTSATTPALCL